MAKSQDRTLSPVTSEDIGVWMPLLQGLLSVSLNEESGRDTRTVSNSVWDGIGWFYFHRTSDGGRGRVWKTSGHAVKRMGACMLDGSWACRFVDIAVLSSPCSLFYVALSTTPSIVCLPGFVSTGLCISFFTEPQVTFRLWHVSGELLPVPVASDRSRSRGAEHAPSSSLPIDHSWILLLQLWSKAFQISSSALLLPHLLVTLSIPSYPILYLQI